MISQEQELDCAFQLLEVMADMSLTQKTSCLLGTMMHLFSVHKVPDHVVAEVIAGLPRTWTEAKAMLDYTAPKSGKSALH